MINCTFTSNKKWIESGYVSSYDGGAFRFEGNGLTIINSTFIDNSCVSRGGAISCAQSNDKNIVITNCTFINNKARSGGALFLSNCKNFYIFNSTFINNTAREFEGGAVQVWNKGVINFDNCKFIENNANWQGGAIWTEADILINNSLFYKNNAIKNGGAIYSYDHNLNVDTCAFIENNASQEGGAIYASVGDIVKSVFLDNHATSGDKTIISSANLNYNWFGNTFEDYKNSPNVTGKITNWLFLNNTHERLMLVGKEMPVKFIFQVWKNSKVSEYDSSNLYPVELNLSSTLGDINKICSCVGEDILYNASAVGNGTITGKFFDRTFAIDLICKIPTEIIVSDPMTIYVDQIVNFTGGEFSALLIPSEAGSLTYSTDNENILNVTNNNFMGFNEGVANLIIEFIETTDYAPSKVLLPIIVLKYDTEIYVNNNSITMDYGDFKTIEAELNPNVGNFVYSSDDVNIATVNNKGLITTVSVGTTTLNIKFEGNRKYYASNKTIQLTINKINSSIVLTKDIEFNYDGFDYTLANVEGINSIEAFVLNHPEAIVNVNNNKITVSGLDVGNYTLLATTIPDGNHISVNTTSSIVVHKSNSIISIPTISFDYGSSATVDAYLNGATRLTNVKVENHPEALIYVSGKSITISELDAGTYTLCATTVPDSNHYAVNGTTTITVNKVNSIIEFTNDLVFDYENSDYTTATIRYATNITDVKVENHPEAIINITNNVITVSGLDAGSYTLSATTVPDKNHNPVTDTAKITVNKINSVLSIEHDVVFDYGESNSTTAIFSGANSIKASVVGSSATINVVGGKITVSGLNAGTYTLRVTTNPDSNHKSVYADAKITVNKVNPVITISPVIFDYEKIGSTRVLTTANVNLEAKVLNHPEATVTISGKKISISNLETGNYILEVNTLSDSNYNPITLTTNITVNKIDSIIVVDDIIFDYGGYGSTEVYLDGADKFNASVINHPEAIVGIVGNEIFVSGLNVGDYYLNITSIPDENHNSITITPIITVSKVNASIIIPTIIFDYDNSTTVSPIMDGISKISYAFVTNHKEALVEISDNNEITVSGLNAGKYTLIATVVPDDNHNPISSINADIIVNKINSTVFVPEINFNYGLYGSTKVILNGATKFKANIDGDATHLTINDDVIVIFGLDAGIYNLSVTTVPDTNHNAVTSVSKIIVNKLGTVLSSSDVTKVYGATKNIIVKLNDVNGNLLVNELVKVTLNNVVYSARVTSNGQAIISVPSNLAVKTYIATITFDGNTNYEKATTTVKVTVKKATPKLTAKAKTLKRSDKTKKYTVTLKTNQNKVMKNTKVTIKVNKKTYTAKTNSKGVATFKLTKLTKKGKYTANVKYAGSKYYNAKSVNVKITIK